MILFPPARPSFINFSYIFETPLNSVYTRRIVDPQLGVKLTGKIEGYEIGHWILLDYIDVIVHIFSVEAREFYGLERLWGDAPHHEISAEAGEAPSEPS